MQGLGYKVKKISSPRLINNSPLASLAKQHGINFNQSGTNIKRIQGVEAAVTQQPEVEDEKK